MFYNDEEEEDWGDKNEKDAEDEFQDLNPSEHKKRIPNNRPKLQPKPQKKKKEVQECEFAIDDPIKRRQLANYQHVPVRLEAGEKMNINVQYDDGQVRKFGQQKAFEEKLIPISKSGTFIYEASTGKLERKNPGRPREDTRSLFDDPKLQKMRNNYVPKLLQRITTNNTKEVDEEEGVQDPGVSWKPVKSVHEVPESFYMRQVFDKSASGPRSIDKSKIKSEYDAFRLFFDNDIYNTIIKHTRERYQQKVEEQIYSYIHGMVHMGIRAKKPTLMQWEFTEYELEAYFAVQIFFGIVRLSNQRDYWKSSARQKPIKKAETGRRKLRELAQEKMDRYAHWVTQRMSSIVSYEKFKTIRNCLNISGAEALKLKGRDPIWKIRDFLNQMNMRFAKYYYPGEFITIDEGMIPFAGKVQFKVYNPDKPTKWGIKEYLLCDASNTYTFQLRLYHGQTMWNNDFKQTMFVNEEDTQHRTMELVLQMCKDYEHKAHKVVMDNYYSSWMLFRELRNRGIGAVGTIRHNRTGLTKKDLTSKHFQQIYNQYHYAYYLNQSNELMLMYFQGTSEKEIALISNFLDNSLNEQHMWDISKQHYYVPHLKAPYMMYVYNKYKGGVDRRNSYVVKYRSRFPAKKWWQSVFERLFETAILNAYLIFRSYNPESSYRNKGQMRDFRINLMYQFAERYKSYEHQQEENGKNRFSYFAKIQPHTFIEGEEIVKCSECGNETKVFCQECTILKAEVVGLCHEKDTIKCQRFHEFMDFELDKNKEVIDKRKGKDPYKPNFLEKLNQRTNAKGNQSSQKKESPLVNLLNKINDQIKQEARVKQEVKREDNTNKQTTYIIPEVKSEDESSTDSDIYIQRTTNQRLIEIHQKIEQMSMCSEEFLNGSVANSQENFAERDENDQFNDNNGNDDNQFQFPQQRAQQIDDDDEQRNSKNEEQQKDFIKKMMEFADDEGSENEEIQYPEDEADHFYQQLLQQEEQAIKYQQKKQLQQQLEEESERSNISHKSKKQQKLEQKFIETSMRGIKQSQIQSNSEIGQDLQKIISASQDLNQISKQITESKGDNQNSQSDQ
ncbi:unnamed protein product (macronuclear) [Paramecium tetraurelia]|uniref:PiggyBac transposable element-derived protein domain-containing protein n=1 Tax=Paramecium tetraurelia TaxID=5888 RepID=A0DFJ7_PARTE|nr:uncharacterized protein GSPATT00016627001 [Paramecium tetraurelia]CAK81814.1 unnamed protein product [Paramecium tetraurelia]|eukprot:XP_001449211.1 hypothetical protein (macronuclear) [Paramecium tetraurelia strain d4-2]